MAHFIGRVVGPKGDVQRTGTKNAGLSTYAEGWGGKIRVNLNHLDSGQDSAFVTLESKDGRHIAVLYSGLLDEFAPHHEKMATWFAAKALTEDAGGPTLGKHVWALHQLRERLRYLPASPEKDRQVNALMDDILKPLLHLLPKDEKDRAA